MEEIQLNDVVGIAVVFIIISVLAFALLKQIKYTKSLDNMVANTLFLKQLKRKSKIITVTLLAVLLFFTMNILTGLNIISSIYISNNFTALGTFVSFFVYLYAKFAMAPKNPIQPKSLYN